MENFNKVQAFDELMEVIKTKENSPVSVVVNAMIIGQNYLKKIHDDAFQAGFEKGCEANNVVNDLKESKD